MLKFNGKGICTAVTVMKSSVHPVVSLKRFHFCSTFVNRFKDSLSSENCGPNFSWK